MMARTPGPWKCDERVGCVAVYPASENYNCLSGGRFIHYANDAEPETIANARLIAAAPEMYEALKRLERLFTTLGPIPMGGGIPVEIGMGDVIERAKSAIAKAEGSSNAGN